MRTYLDQQTITIRRQTFVGNKSSYSDLATVNAYVRPLSEEEASVNGLQFGKGQFVMVDDTTDIQEGDEVVFNGIKHAVAGVANHNRGISIPKFKQVIMTEPQGD